MAKHSRRSRWARRTRVVATASAVVLFVVLAVAGLLGYNLRSGAGDGPDTTLADAPAQSSAQSPAQTSSQSSEASTGAADQTSASTSDSTGAPVTSGSQTSLPTAPVTAPSVTASASITSPGADPSLPPRQKVLRAGPALKLIPQPVVSTFRIASYNVLGSQHKANGPGRARTAAGLIANRGIDIVGLQEMQDDQRAAMTSALPGYAVWPGDALGNQGYRHQILYRTDRFEVVGGGSVPYTFDSQTVPLPYAEMRDKESGGDFYLIDAHNSARGLEGQRDSATGIEADLINRLKSSGLPVLITIDANEHTEWFCDVAGRSGVVSANGGYYSGGCHLPGGPLRIDWIAGTGTGDAAVDFSGYVQDITPEHLGISDHYLIYADATVTSPPPDDETTDDSQDDSQGGAGG